MAIDALNRESAQLPGGSTTAKAVPFNSAGSTPGSVADGGAGDVTPASVADAVRTLDAALNAGPNPDFDLDYLSGLSVVTVRSRVTGEVVFQLPDRRAVELARLVTQGKSAHSLGLLDVKV